ncbi:MAG: hypothetical protein LBC20_15530, partial [Planctomycetaceae bacterium]|nr:hypothetical protein [Planctomycetaceae bacterium]
MFIIILVLNFIVCFLFSCAVIRHFLSERPTPYVALYESFVVACILFATETWFFIEGLSVFNALKTPEPLALLYFLSFLILITGIFCLRKSLQNLVNYVNVPVDIFVRNFVILIMVLIILPLIFVSIYYPPCTADSMSYHLPRILHWIQNGNIAIYPSNYPRQLFYQPFAEYLVLPCELFVGNDYFDNTIQIIALIGVFCLLALLVRYFGGGGRCQILACLLTLSAPIVIFEAPTTQTDIITTFFFLAFVYFGLKLSTFQSKPLLRTETIFYTICMGITLGLGLNTKVSIVTFEIPFCCWFGLQYLKTYRKKVILIYGLLVLGFLVFNVPYFIRNAQICGHIFGPIEGQNGMRNLRFGPDVIFSNAVRNIGMQLRIPNETVNQYNKNFLIRL